MSVPYRVQGLKDAQLISKLSELAQRDKRQMAELLAHLSELDARRLFLDMGYSSIWEYCMRALGFCQTSAWRRYTAARVCREYPDVFEKVAQGDLHLSVLAELSPYLTADNAGELLEACNRQSLRQVKRLLAARFPSPDWKDSVRRMPTDPTDESAAARPNGDTPSDEPHATSPDGASVKSPSARERVEPLSAGRFGVRFTADNEFLELLEEVRGLASHSNPKGDLLTVLKAGLAAYRSELLKNRFGVGRKPRPVVKARRGRTAPAPGEPEERRAVPAAVLREVFERDGNQCTYVSPDGRRCSSRRFLQLDHIDVHHLGPDDTAKNLRIRCSAHNQHSARQFFGTSYMDAVMKHVRNGSGP